MNSDRSRFRRYLIPAFFYFSNLWTDGPKVERRKHWNLKCLRARYATDSGEMVAEKG